jgi:phage baseplate assembly protein W
VQRQDYSFPFRIDVLAQQATQASAYASHVVDMIKQILFTAPGERADLPEFGCDVRKLLFAPNSDALAATAQITIQQALTRWLGDQIAVQSVTVTPPEDTPDQSQLLILIQYVLIETQSTQGLEVLVQ